MSTAGTTPILLALPSFTPSLALEILPYGLTIHRLFVQADGKTHDLVIGPESPLGHTGLKYTNTIIGRYANRLPVAEHTLVSSRASDIKATFTPVSNESPAVSLHGGINGFDEKFWEPIPFPPNPGEVELFSDKELETIMNDVATAAIFKTISEDGEEGFPGRLRIEVLVGLLQPKTSTQPTEGEWNLGSIILVYRAKLIDAKTVTPINLTQHWGFNLDASLAANTSIKDHSLTIKSSKILDLDTSGLATGRGPSSGDFFNSHQVVGSRYPDSGYDHFFIFNQTDETTPKIFNGDDLSGTDFIRYIVSDEKNEPKVVLEGGHSGIKLSFSSNQSGVQFYSNSSSTGFGSKKKIHGGDGSGEMKKGGGYEKGEAAFLEFHEPYPAFLHPGISPSGYDTLLTSGEIYNNFVKVDVGFKHVGL